MNNHGGLKNGNQILSSRMHVLFLVRWDRANAVWTVSYASIQVSSSSSLLRVIMSPSYFTHI